MYILKKTSKNIVKQDMNFLEFPLWVTDKRETQSSFVIEVKNGKYFFNANSEIGIPDSFDALILYYFLFISQNKNSRSITFNKFEICKNLKLPKNSKNYNRIEKSLDIWGGVYIKFEGCFYVGDQKYTSMGFHIFKHKTKEKTGNKHNVIEKIIELEFDRDFSNAICDSKFFKNIDLNLWIALKRPLARRLYEYLLKQFINKGKFSISSEKLFPKIGLNIERYPSDTKKQMNSISVSVRKINEFDTKLDYQFDFYINEEKEFICVFRKENVIVEVKHTEVKTIESDREIRQKLREYGVYRNSIATLLKQHSVKVLSDAILDLEFLAEQKSKTNKPVRNMGSFLRELLPEPNQDYEFSDEYIKHKKELEYAEVRKKKELEKRKQEQTEKEEREQNIILEKKVDSFIVSLSNNKKTELNKEAVESLKLRGINKKSIGYDMLIKLEVKRLTVKKYDIKLEKQDLTDESIEKFDKTIKEHKEQEKDNNILTESQLENIEKQALKQTEIDYKSWAGNVSEKMIKQRFEINKTNIAKKLYDVKI